MMLANWSDRWRERIETAVGLGRGRQAEPLEQLCDRLLQATSTAVRQRVVGELLARYAATDDAGRRDFLALLATRYNADPDRLRTAIDRYQAAPSAGTLAALHAASEPRRQQILRRLNEGPGGMAMLLRMRTDALRIAGEIPDFAALDADFAHLFSSWFSGGFLTLRRLDWSTPGAVLTKLMDYEAVHAIESWEALRARLEPSDRRCYAFFHPLLEGEPLIFVEVALTTAIPTSIIDVLRADRTAIAPGEANTAVFYSISNCQQGLRGIPFGGPLIKQVMDLLQRELPGLRRAVTLSPMPGFAAWLARQQDAGWKDERLNALPTDGAWFTDPERALALREPLLRAAARYLLTARGREADPVARFHLGNGARIEQLNHLGDISAKGLRQSHGMMVNYLYDAAHVDANHRAFAEQGTVAASSAVRRLSRDESGARLSWRAGRG